VASENTGSCPSEYRIHPIYQFEFVRYRVFYNGRLEEEAGGKVVGAIFDFMEMNGVPKWMA
jgi:hypothetical protein